ncbi:hypothetical protein XSR1_420007 [Xenorhabdus szentirmaii DSM 16338]|uniref:Uncharacterized protein n=1 Tax=Xenorhabdus szentirmaii DSM 16338 TaxID=1427518 RepID=W1J307_9GAMM|nr:hypothetical protein XSR1_420007 [Xenorhabdus szentirmaii DSM 16338]
MAVIFSAGILSQIDLRIYLSSFQVTALLTQLMAIYTSGETNLKSMEIYHQCSG